MTYSGMMTEVNCVKQIKKIKLENNKLKKIIVRQEKEIDRLNKEVQVLNLQLQKLNNVIS